MKVTCREYTLHRSYESSRTKRRIRGNTKIGPVLDVKISYHKKTIRCCDDDRIITWRQDCILGSYHEWNQQIRDRNGRNNSNWMYWKQLFKETCCWAKGETVFSCHERNQWLGQARIWWANVYSLSWKTMDRYWTSRIQSRLSWSINVYFMIKFLRHNQDILLERDGAVGNDDLLTRF